MDPYLANMKKTSPSSRSKPPPVRNAYLSGKLRNHLGLERPGFHFSSGIDNSNRLLSMSENPEVPETVDNIRALKASSKEVTDCMSRWLTFIQLLRQLCVAGADLSRSLDVLAGPTSACQMRAAHCRAMWEHLSGATEAATAVVKNQVITSLQEAHTGPDIDADQLDINQQVVCSGLMTLVNLQYQFSVACCECLRGLADCRCQMPHGEPDSHAVSRCFTRLPAPPPPQRRWSEAAGAAEVKVGLSEARRWSVPWKLSLPASSSSERSRSTTPDAIWHTALASQEELQDVISLLSINPGHQSHHLPGVTLTRAVEPMASRCSSHRGSWWGDGEEPDVGMLMSRKSSSSTDCSSCYSLHSRTSTSGSDELTHGQRSHLYSMWSGSDLPFIKLPESKENPDT